MFKGLIITLIFCGFVLKGHSQDQPSYGNWIMYFGQQRLTDKLSLHSEVQYRDFAILQEADQLLLRAGLNFHLADGNLLTAGYGRILNYDLEEGIFNPVLSAENRIWQQLILKSKLGKVIIDHRYRLEQRWISVDGTVNYKNRARYFLRLLYPLNSNKLEAGSLFAAAYNEVFLNFGSSTSFDRNRFYLAIGYQLNKSLQIQLGNLVQSTNSHSKSHLQIGVFHNLDLRSDERK